MMILERLVGRERPADTLRGFYSLPTCTCATVDLVLFLVALVWFQSHCFLGSGWHLQSLCWKTEGPSLDGDFFVRLTSKFPICNLFSQILGLPRTVWPPIPWALSCESRFALARVVLVCFSPQVSHHLCLSANTLLADCAFRWAYGTFSIQTPELPVLLEAASCSVCKEKGMA
jgi:hypothetical protein